MSRHFFGRVLTVLLAVAGSCPLFAASPKSFPAAIVSSTRANGPIFNTGLFPNRTFHTRIVYSVPAKTTGEAILFGERHPTFRYDDFFQTHNASLGHHFQFGPDGWNLNWDSGHGGAFGKISTLEAGIRGISLDGTVYKTADEMAKWYPNYTGTSPYQMALLTSNDTGTDETQWNSYGRSFEGSIYEVVIWTNTTVQARHYYPCVADDDTVGLYDTVTDTFLARVAGNSNYNKGTLTADGTSDKIRLESDGSIAFKCEAAPCTNLAGSVTLNGSSDASWIVKGTAVQVVATPAEGCTFVRWTGSTEYITSGAVTDSAITVTPTLEPVSFVAEFTGSFVKDRTLTIQVAEGTICSDNYFTTHIQPVAGTEQSVTNIEKIGAGALKLVANTVYDGDWHVREGEVEIHDDNSFGKAGTTTESNGRVFVSAGASIFALPGVAGYAMKYKDIYLAGSGWGGCFDATATDGILDPYRKGALVGSTRQWNESKSGWDYNSTYYAYNVRFHLTDDAAYYQPNRPLVFNGGSIDVNGHTFTMTTPGAGNIHISSETITNSSATAGTLTFAHGGFKSWFDGVTFAGSPDNVFDGRGMSSYPVTLQGKVTSSWLWKMGTVDGKDCRMGSSKDQKNPDGTTAQYNGRIAFEGTTYFYNHDTSGYALTLYGEITGDADATWQITRGFSLNIGATNNTFAGTVRLDANNRVKDGVTYTARIKYLAGAQVSAGAYVLEGANLVFDDSLTFDAAPITVSGACTVAGGSSDATFQCLTIAKAGTLTWSATGSLQHLVAETNAAIVLPAGTTTVGRLTGAPAVSGGTLKALAWEIDAATAPVLTTGMDVSAAQAIPVTSDGATLTEGQTTVLYVAPGAAVPAFNRFYAQLAADATIVYSTETVESGDYAGYTAVVATVTAGAGTGTATWAQPTEGGDWSAAASWADEAVPPFGPATAIGFPKATASGVAVDMDANGSFGSLSFATGAGLSDYYTPFGYVFSGTGWLVPDAGGATMTFCAGQNTIDAPLAGDGTLTVETELYPLTNLTDAAYSQTTLSEDALAAFTGTLTVNPAKRTWNGRTELQTGAFAGKLVASAGEVKVDSLAFVTSRDDLTLNGTMTLAYAGGDATIPGLTWNAWLGDINVAEDATLTVDDFYTKESSTALYKTGLGTLKLSGTGTATFTRSDAGGKSTDHGFSWAKNFFGRPSYGRYQPISICQGTLEVGTRGDSASAPTVTATAMTLGNHNAATDNARLVVNNGSVNVSGTLWLPYYSAYENDQAVRGITVYGGSFHAKETNARIGYTGSDGRPYGRQVFEVNGGTFTIDKAFNLTQLCPYEKEAGRKLYQATMTHTFTVNDGAASFGNFKMGYSYGLTWDGKISDNNGYGHGWQPDAYLTVNGGEVTVTDYLLTTDRADSRSWTALNGGVLKVNMISNTVGTAASTYLTFNGGTLAPTGDGDNPDELALKASFTSAVVSTNGAVVTTAYIPSDATYVIEQALTHDPLCEGEDGGFTKQGAGTLELKGANTFTGPVTVEGGTLVLSGSTALPRRANQLALAAGAKLRLGSGVVRVKSLAVDGAKLGSGLYGSSASGAKIVRDDLFEGAGVLQVGRPGIALLLQ